MNVLEKSIMSLHTKTKEIRDDIINHASQQKTIEKSSANLLKQTKATYQNIAQKEIEIEDLRLTLLIFRGRRRQRCRRKAFAAGAEACQLAP